MPPFFKKQDVLWFGNVHPYYIEKLFFLHISSGPKYLRFSIDYYVYLSFSS